MRRLKQFMLAWVLLAQTWVYTVPVYANDTGCSCNSAFLSQLASPKGAAVVGIIYGLAGFFSNFVWAYNWQKHSNVTSDVSATRQEIGGLISAAENLVLGCVVSVGLAVYAWQQARSPADPFDPAKMSQTFLASLATQLAPHLKATELTGVQVN